MKILFVTLFVVIIDQLTKFLVKGLKVEWLGINFEGMPYGTSKPLIGEFIKLTFIENPGMAFGINVGPKMFLTIFTIAASIFIFFYIYKHRKDGILIRLALALILAGAIGNLIDRTFYGVIYNYAPLFNGKVVDFMQVEFWDFTFMGRTYTTWPIWNIADAAVSLGFLIILFFHNKIFKPEQPVIDTPELANRDIPLEMENNTAQLDNPENRINGNGSVLSDLSINKNNQSFNNISKSEDTEENVDSSPGGTNENKN